MKSRTIALVSPLIVLLVIAAFASPSTLAASGASGQAPQVRAAFQGTSPLAAAFAKTTAATVYKMREDFSGSPLLMPGPAATAGDKPVTALHAEAEFNGKDYNVTMRGIVASLFNDDPAKDFQVIQVSDKTYVHGPASTFSAPEDKWYQLDPGNTMSMSFSPFETLNRIAGSKGGWDRFKQSQTGVSLDGVKCDSYSAGTEAAADIYGALVQDMMPPDQSPVLDTGTVSFSVCGDGYVHNLVADFTAHDKTKPASKGTGKYSLDLSGFGSGITIAAPTDAVNLGSSSAQDKSTPTPGRQVAAGSATGYEGDWEGTTKDDMDISFSVENNEVTFINLGYAVHTGNCSVSGSYSLNPPKTVVANKGFSLQLTDSSGRQYTFAATFDSGNQAHGTLRVKGTSDSCGAFDVQSTWTANLMAAAPTPDSSASTSGSSTAATADAGSVIGGLFEMLNAKNADAALDLVSDDVIVNWGATTIMDKDQLKTFFTSQTGRGITYKVSNAQVVGDTIVNFVVQESGGGSTLYGKSTAIVSDGLISILTLK